MSFLWVSWFGLGTIVWILLSCGGILYFCGNPHAPGPLGLFTGLVYLLMEIIGNGLKRIVGERVSNSAAKLWQYVFKQKNPLLQLAYLLLVNGGYVVFYYSGQRHFIHPGSYHTPVIALTMVMNFVTFWICSRTDPGTITKENIHGCLEMFGYDQSMYLSQVLCPTCTTEKPARSKHCAMCERCIMKFDHHCVWVNNCIGLNNYRYFIWFLAQHVWFTGYGTYLVSNMLMHVISTNNLWNLSYKDTKTGAYVPADYFFLFQYISYYHGLLWGLLLLLSIMCFVLFGFTLYHLHLALSNTTTNERSKRGWIEQGINVHAYAELYALNPYYMKIQQELKDLNAEIIKQAYEDIGQQPPNKEERALTAAATAAATAHSEGKEAEAKPTTDAATGATSSSTAAGSSAPAAASTFPPPPYSLLLRSKMTRYHTLKTEVISVYHQIQKLQQQEFTSTEQEEAVKEGRGSMAPRAVGGQTGKAGMKVAGVEATEGCVPTSAPVAAAANGTSSASSSATSPAKKKQRRPNPYSLGLRANFLQLICPPKVGDKVPLAGATKEKADTSSSNANGTGAAVKKQTKKQR